MRAACLVPWIVLGLLFPGQLSSLFGQNGQTVATLVHDVSEVADGSVTQARFEAQRQIESGGLPYRSYAKGDYRSFSGKYTPPELPEDKKGRFVYGLALFSDDGCNVTVNGSQIHKRKEQGQHLPNIGESFHVLQTALAPGEPVDITVDYSNIIYDNEPKSPGYPDIDGCTLFLYLLPMGIAVDANRDGIIAFSGEARDATSQAAPFRFWCNKDQDQVTADGENDVVPAGQADHLDQIIQGRRDLEDFTRLWLHVEAFSSEIANGTFKVGLKWRNATGAPAISVYKSADTAGSPSYLTDDTAATIQVGGTNRNVLGTVSNDGDMLILPTDFWSGSSAQNANKCLIFEGASEGQGQLVLTIRKSDGSEVEGPGVWLDLMSIKKMYQRGKAQPEGIAAPHNSPSGPFSGPTSFEADLLFEKDRVEEKKAVVFVHGWSMTYNDYLNFSETMFKRLWHQGFKGRFCSFRWDPVVANEARLYAGEYNRSEHRAFLYGQGLRQFVESIKQDIPAISVVGHSMGNIVCSSALEQGLTVKNYLLMEAAVPAGCYDEGGGRETGGINGYEDFWEAEDGEHTPDYHQAPNGDLTKGYRGFLRAIGGVANRIVNFHNLDDFALATGTKFFFFEANWEKNQIDYKPDGSSTGIHAGDWRYFYNTNETNLSKKGHLENVHFINSSPVWALTRHVNDSYEMKSFNARPRSKAVGAVDQSLRNRPAMMEHVNLQDYDFDGRESDHSGQFNRRIQEVDELYRDITAILNAGQ